MPFITGSKKPPTPRLEPTKRAPNLNLVIISKRKESDDARNNQEKDQ
jgi:hypothetical protein